MALQPFKVRLTGDGSGTLDAVHATIELVDRAAPSLDPWAWFRADDLTGYTDQQPFPIDAEWYDRTGNGRNLILTDRTTVSLTNRRRMLWVASAVDGHPGVTLEGAVASSVRDIWRSDFTAVGMPDGYTHFVVRKAPDWSVSCIVSPSASPFQGQELIWEPGFYQSFQDGGTNPNVRPYIDGHDPDVDDGAVWQASMGAAGADSTILGYDGGGWSDGSAFGSVVVGDATYFSGATFATMVVSIGSDLDTLAEWIVFDRFLAGTELAYWWSYLKVRYPSVGWR